MGAESLPTDKLIGQVLASRYQILHRLGEGAMGVVYKARHVKVGRSFAVKILHARLLSDPKLALRFDREAELAGRLRHANVVGVVDVGEVDGMRYMVMDFAEGPDLARLLVEAPMPPDRIIRLVRQMLEGLHHAHEQGLIHRDFKPENVIIERDPDGAEMPRIVDFGIAILRDGGDTVDGQGRLTTNGLVLGTPHYMAPEQAVADPIDHRVDLFALGIVVYEMLCGRLPFDGSGAEVARANVMLDPPRIADRVPYLEVDPLLEAFARRLMAKKRSARPATARAARELLDLIDRDRPAAAAALGVATSAYTPAVTQSVPPQEPSSSYAEPSPAPTTQLRATPSLSGPVRPPAMPAPPPDAPAPPPIARSAAHAPPTAPAKADHETAIQTPLDWPPSHNAKRRRRLLIAGAALGAAGGFATVLVAWSAKQDTPTAADQVAMIVRPDTTDAGSVSGPEATDPKATDPKATDPKAADPKTPDPGAPDPTVTDPKATGVIPPDPTTTEPTTAGTRTTDPIDDKTRPPAKRPPAHDSKSHEATGANARAHSRNTGDKTAEATEATATTDTTDTRAADARAASRTGTTASELSRLYYSIPAYFGQLPKDRSESLRNRWRRFNVQALMAGPQAERDQAADQLSQLLQEARLLASGSSAPPMR